MKNITFFGLFLALAFANNEICEDKNLGCSRWKNYCDGQYKDFMDKNCPKTCNTCSGSGQTSCDVSKTFGKLNGDHILTLTANGEYR